MWDINMKGTRLTFSKPDPESDKARYILPSDSIRRPDGLAIKQEDWETAEDEKKKLE